MCYNYSLSKIKVDLEERYDATLEYEWITQYHVSAFGAGKLPVITAGRPKAIQAVHWGLIPSWVSNKQQAQDIRTKTINAKSETVFDLPSFKGSIERKRCLVPADGFFEWMDVKKEKIPYYISLKNRGIFSMAGIYDAWIDKQTGEEIRTFSVLTCDANPLMAKIHNLKKRMPVILSREKERQWLDPHLKKEDIQSLLRPYPEEHMQAWTISNLISSKTEDTNVAKVIEKSDRAFTGSLF